MKLLLLWLINALAVYLTAQFVPGLHLDDWKAAFLVALALGLINMIVKPVLKLLSMPLILLTLGLFLLVINAVSLYLADYFVDGFRIDGFLPALLGALVISIISTILTKIFARD